MTKVSMAGKEIFEKVNDYTLSVVIDFDRQHEADPELRRIFNFKAQKVTEIYSMWYSNAISTSMQSQNFSDMDSLDEVELMHAKLIELEGNPPEIRPKTMSFTNKHNP